MEWALKRQHEHPLLPASEFLCYRLAQACALATPFDAVLVDIDGAPVFGSRIEAGLLDPAANPAYIERLPACAGRMSACYALDLVVGNEDRHFGNFLYRELSGGGLAAVVIDWSRAWWVRGWPPQTICGRPCYTTTHMAILRAMGLWSAPDALATLSRLSMVGAGAIDSWVASMPPQWLSPVERATLAAWWGSPAFHTRIAQCVDFCK